MNQAINTKPILRGHFHQAMFFVCIGALIPLLLQTKNSLEFISILIYSLCTLALFGISSIYHRVNWPTNEKRMLWKKLDHAGIFLMIAGGFTPVSLLALPVDKGMTLLKIIWAVAALGIIQSIFFIKIPKLANAILYIGMGYLIVPYMHDLYISLGVHNVALILAGGIAYTIGAICYGLKKPILKPSVFGYHEVFHLFVNLGAILHFIVISSLIHH